MSTNSSVSITIPDEMDYKTNRLTFLQGTVLSEFLIPTEYAPSRSYTSRWGVTRPPIAPIAEMCSECIGPFIDLVNEAIELLDYLKRIPRDFKHENLPVPGFYGVPLNPIDSIMIYTLITHYRPETYLEIGSGASTCFVKRAVDDHGLGTKIISIDPEPRASIDNICDTVIRTSLEEADLSVFGQLQPGDIVFLDGSHRCFMNSDVTVFMIDVLPMLKPGVLVHVHDVSLPYDYPDAVKQWYWNEQYLLAVYLMAKRESVKIIAPHYWMTGDERVRPALARLFDGLGFEYANGGSFWFTHSR